MANFLSIPIPDQVQEDLRQMLESVAREVIQAAAECETKSRDFMTISETCTYMNTSYGTVKKWITQDGLKCVILDGKKFISKETLKKWLHDHEQ